MIDLLHTFDKFDEHVNKYDMNDSMISLKYFHSYRVMVLCGEIADDLNLNVEDIYLAMVIGLIHDYARFKQWDKYKTYKDKDSIDHGDLACELLFDNDEIKKFDIDSKYYNIIYDALKYHNKYSYPDNLNERNKLFCKIIRDADKLDIFYLCGSGDIQLPTDNSEISDKINNEFYKNNLLNRKHLNNVNDNVLLKLAMVFDLNFGYSYKYLKDNKIIDNILNKLENKQKFEPYFNYVKGIIEKREKVYVRKKI